MKRTFISFFSIYIIIFLTFYQTQPVLAEQPLTLDETRQLLTKGLTIYELDQHIARLTEQDKELSKQIADTAEQIEKQKVLVDEKRIHAGKILNSYYMGERDQLWLLIFSADSFFDALTTLDYLAMIFDHDRDIMMSHTQAYRELQDLHQQLVLTQTQLNEIKEAFIAQRERMLHLQEELDKELAGRDDGDAIKDQINLLTRIWEEQGLPIFKHYFQALEKAIQKLPNEVLAGGNIKFEKGKLRITVTDQELTNFLREQNPDDFNHFRFTFANNELLAYGAHEDIAISISGTYTLLEEYNLIEFTLTNLVFNGYELPDTTMREMEEDFDLNFNPNLIDAPFEIKVSDVAISDGQLDIWLKL